MAEAASVTTFVMENRLPWPDESNAADAQGPFDSGVIHDAGFRWNCSIRRISSLGATLRGDVAIAPGQDIAHGIYAVRVEHKGKRYQGAGYVGPRPTFGTGQPVIEVYLFNFDGDLYGEEIEVEFMAHLRPDATFANGEELATQMREDIRKAQALLMMCEMSDPIAHFPLARALSGGTGL